MVVPTRRVTRTESFGQEFNTLIKCIEFVLCRGQCLSQEFGFVRASFARKDGRGWPAHPRGWVGNLLLYQIFCIIGFYDCKHLALQVLALRLLIITCAMCCAIVVDRLGRNTCVTGDSAGRILATAIGRADSLPSSFVNL